MYRRAGLHGASFQATQCLDEGCDAVSATRYSSDAGGFRALNAKLAALKDEPLEPDQ